MMSRGDGEIPRLEPGCAAKKASFTAMLQGQFQKLAQVLMSRPAPTLRPAQRRRRSGDTTRAAFTMVAARIVRPPARIPAAAYRGAVAYLADTIDWLNLWHEGEEFTEDAEPSPAPYLYPHL